MKDRKTTGLHGSGKTMDLPGRGKTTGLPEHRTAAGPGQRVALILLIVYILSLIHI